MSSLHAFWIHHRTQLAGLADDGGGKGKAAPAAEQSQGAAASGAIAAEDAWAETMRAWAPVGQMLLRLRAALCTSVAKTHRSMVRRQHPRCSLLRLPMRILSDPAALELGP